jgi:hypothetical protein
VAACSCTEVRCHNEAFARAKGFAQSQHVDVWQIADDGVLTLIMQYRSPVRNERRPAVPIHRTREASTPSSQQRR